MLASVNGFSTTAHLQDDTVHTGNFGWQDNSSVIMCMQVSYIMTEAGPKCHLDWRTCVTAILH